MTTPTTDSVCQHLADFIQSYLNSGSELTVVKSTRSYDALNVPYRDFPLLKVYRLTEDGEINQNETNVQVVIAYHLVLPEMESLQALLGWVRKRVREALWAYSNQYQDRFPRLDRGRYRAEYRTMLNYLTKQVESFLRITLQLRDL